MSGPRGMRQIFLWPIILGAMTLVGLISALVADGVWDALSWLTLLIPVGIGIAKGWFGPR